MRATLVRDRLIINGRPYTVDDLEILPINSADVEALSTITKDDYVFFYGRTSPFSNFKPCRLVIDGIYKLCMC